MLAKVPPESFPCSTLEDVEHFFMVLSFIDMAVGSERPPRPQRAKLRELQVRWVGISCVITYPGIDRG